MLNIGHSLTLSSLTYTQLYPPEEKNCLKITKETFWPLNIRHNQPEIVSYFFSHFPKTKVNARDKR